MNREQHGDRNEAYTLEIKGKPALVFAAADQNSAWQHIQTNFFRADLAAMETDSGEPLWNGDSALVIREAAEEERALLDEAVTDAISTDDLNSWQEALDCNYGIYLFPVRVPADAFPT